MRNGGDVTERDVEPDGPYAVDAEGVEGIWHTLVPALAVLLALDLVLDGVAVYLLSRASSSAVR